MQFTKAYNEDYSKLPHEYASKIIMQNEEFKLRKSNEFKNLKSTAVLLKYLMHNHKLVVITMQLVSETEAITFGVRFVNSLTKEFIFTLGLSSESFDGEYYGFIRHQLPPTKHTTTASQSNYPPYVILSKQLDTIMQEYGYKFRITIYPPDQPNITLPDHQQTLVYLAYVTLFAMQRYSIRASRLPAPIIDVAESFREDFLKYYYSDNLKYQHIGIKSFILKNIHEINSLPIYTPYNEIYALEAIARLRNEWRLPAQAPFYYGNYTLDAIAKNMFRNIAMHERIRESEATVEHIKRMKMEMHAAQSEMMREDLQDEIDRLDAMGITSGKTLLLFENHVSGEQSTVLREAQRDLREPDWQAIIFEISYQLYVMSLQKIIQGDLHLGNVILNEFVRYNAEKMNMCEYTMPAPQRPITGEGEPIIADEEMWKQILHQELKPSTSPLPLYEADYAHGEMKFYLPRYNFYNVAAVIDYSRSIIFDARATEGIQPFKAYLLERRMINLWESYNDVLCARKDGKDSPPLFRRLNDKKIFATLANENLEATLAAVQGIDLLLYLRRVTRILKPENSADSLASLEPKIAIITAIVNERLTLLDEGHYETLIRLDNAYLLIVDRIITLWRVRPNQEFKLPLTYGLFRYAAHFESITLQKNAEIPLKVVGVYRA